MEANQVGVSTVREVNRWIAIFGFQPANAGDSIKPWVERRARNPGNISNSVTSPHKRATDGGGNQNGCRPLRGL